MIDARGAGSTKSRAWTQNPRRLLAAGLLAWMGCAKEPAKENPVEGGDAAEGERLVRVYGCAGCHAIPGTDLDATVGPPLSHWVERRYIAGRLVNTPQNLILWLTNPGAVEPGTAMPDLDMTPEEARHIAAFLYTLGDATPPTPADSMPAQEEP